MPALSVTADPVVLAVQLSGAPATGPWAGQQTLADGVDFTVGTKIGTNAGPKLDFSIAARIMASLVSIRIS